MYSKKPLVVLTDMNTNCESTHPATRDVGRKVRRAAAAAAAAVVVQTAEFGLAAKRFRAIDLSCRACGACGAGAGCWAWIPGRGTFGFHPQPPILYLHLFL